MALFQFYQIVAKYYLKTLLRSLKVATLAADNVRLSIILIQSLFLIKEREFCFFLFPLRFKLPIKLFVFYFYCIFQTLSFLFLRTLTITFRHTKSSTTPGKVLRNYWVHLVSLTDTIDKRKLLISGVVGYQYPPIFSFVRWLFDSTSEDVLFESSLRQ